MPPVPPGWLKRPRLGGRLEAARRCRLTVVCAPAGFGKTTLLSEWVAEFRREAAVPGPPAAWLSLDREDNDPERFWTYFVATLQTVQPQLGRSALALLETGKAPSIRAVLTTLINDINEAGCEFVIVLDDYHEISSRSVHDSLAFLVDHLPPQAHLVLAARSDPPLPLALEPSTDDQPAVRCMVVLLLGLALWMKADMAQAALCLEEARVTGQATGNYFISLVAMGHLADIAVRQGRLHQAAEASRKAIRMGTEWGGGEPLPATSYAHICLAQVLYQWNEIEEAIHYIDRAVDLGRQGVQLTIAVIAMPGLAPLTELIGLTTALSDAVEELEGVATASGSAMMSRITAAWRPPAAEGLVAMQRALSLGEPEGYLRVFVDGGEPAADLLRLALARQVRPEYVSEILASFSGAARGGSGAALRGLRVSPAIEPLSPREMEVLRLLADGASNRQIADQLVVVTGTVKAHVLSIYRKLNVHNRTQAVARARDLKLL